MTEKKTVARKRTKAPALPGKSTPGFTGNLFPTPRGYAAIPYRLLDLHQLEVSALDTDNTLALECVSRMREVLGDVAEGLNDWLAVDDKVTVSALESDPWSALRDLTQPHDEDVADKAVDELRDELYDEVVGDVTVILELVGADEDADRDAVHDIRARCKSIMESIMGKGKTWNP